MKINIMYHAKCLDGLASAWVAHKYFSENKDYDIALHPVSYGNPLPELEIGDSVYFVDFCPTLKQLIDLSKTNEVVIIDHHETAVRTVELFNKECCESSIVENSLRYSSTFCINTEKCGATLAWEYFFLGEHVPQALLYIEDRDLWKWELQGTLNYTSFLSGVDSVADFDKKLQEPIEDALDKGSLIAQYNDRLIKDVSNAYPIRILMIEGLNVGFIPCLPRFSSDVCSYILQTPRNLDVVCAYEHDIFNGKIKLSFRSRKASKGEPQTSEALDIAKLFGGGGHKSAAGSYIAYDEFTDILKNHSTD